MSYCDSPKILNKLFDYLMCDLKYCVGMANSVDMNEMLPKKQFDLGLHCLSFRVNIIYSVRFFSGERSLC